MTSTWTVDLDGAEPDAVVHPRRPPTTTIEGTASDLVLWIWNRLPAPSTRLTIEGDEEVLARWTALAI